MTAVATTRSYLANTETRAQRDLRLLFRYNPNSRNPKTGLSTIHTWHGAEAVRCWCGRFRRDDPRLTELTLSELKTTYTAVLCKRCTWHDPAAPERLM